MTDIWARRLNDAVWIPLRASQESVVGRYGYLAYKSELFAVSSVAVPLEKKTEAEALGWTDLGMDSHKGGFEDGRYVPADVFEDSRVGQALPLVIDQSGNGDDPAVWHLHQDLVVTLELKREGNDWLAMDEGYIEVARLSVGSGGHPSRLEIRAEHLKDYLCARGMALYVSSYRSRREVVDDRGHITWSGDPQSRVDSRNRWEGRVREIHEGGEPFGQGMSVVQVTRTKVDQHEDVPRIGVYDEGIEVTSSTRKFEGPKLYEVEGELWRTEWVEPAKLSPRVRRDKVPPSLFFITDSSGTKEASDSLRAGGRWLWFRPGIIAELTRHRGGGLRWYTRDTGQVRCSPAYSGVVFGVNKLGLVNVYAKDVAFLPEWQQRLWAGYNVGPEAGVSEELLASQARGIPARTRAPEELLARAIELLNELTKQAFGFHLFREHADFKALLSRVHRFRSVDQASLLALAKDLARLTADSIDASELQKIAPPPGKEKWGSLKTLEHLIALKVGAVDARPLLSPLHGVYNLRLGDAHLPGNELQQAFALAEIDQSAPFVFQGYQLLNSCVSCLCKIAEVLKQFNDKNNTG